MRTMTPAEFAHKLNKVAAAVKTQDDKAIRARAEVTQKIVTSTAMAKSGLARKYATKQRWVRNKPLGPDAQFVNLRGGFAHLAERGSYRYPSGWDMIATNAQAMTIPGVGSGFAAAVKHPPLKGHPFWRAGLEASRRPGYEAYKKSLRDSIAKAVR